MPHLLSSGSPEPNRLLLAAFQDGLRETGYVEGQNVAIEYRWADAGIVSLTQTLAFEEAKHGIRVNAVCPGLTFTPFHLRRAKAGGRVSIASAALDPLFSAVRSHRRATL